LEPRELLCTIGLDQNSERGLRHAHQAEEEAHCNLHIIHAIQATGADMLIPMDLEEQVQSEDGQQARQHIADLQRRVGSQAPVRIVVGPVKEALLEAVRRFDARLPNTQLKAFDEPLKVTSGEFFYVSQRVAAQMCLQKSGHVVNITSSIVDQPVAGLRAVSSI
jgi:hypothetical protein